MEARASHQLMLLQNHAPQISPKKPSKRKDSSVMAIKGEAGLSYGNRKMRSVGKGCCLSSLSATSSLASFNDFADRSSPDEVKEEIKRCFELVHKLGRGVVYLGSARVKTDQPHYMQSLELAREVGKLLKCTTWTGAGPGLMDAAIKGSFEANVAVGGFKIAREANEWTTSNFHPYLPSESYLTCRFFSARKHALVDAAVRNNPSDMTAVIALPGGVGTLDEMFEILALIQMERIGSKFPVPFLLMNYDSYYSKLLEFIHDCEQWGTVASGEVDSLWKVCSGNAEALDYLADYYSIQESKRSYDTDICKEPKLVSG